MGCISKQGDKYGARSKKQILTLLFYTLTIQDISIDMSNPVNLTSTCRS